MLHVCEMDTAIDGWGGAIRAGGECRCGCGDSARRSRNGALVSDSAGVVSVLFSAWNLRQIRRLALDWTCKWNTDCGADTLHSPSRSIPVVEAAILVDPSDKLFSWYRN